MPAHRRALPGARVTPLDRPPIWTDLSVVAAIAPVGMPTNHRNVTPLVPEFEHGLDPLSRRMKPVAIPSAPASRRPDAFPTCNFLDFPCVAEKVAIRRWRASTGPILRRRDYTRRRDNRGRAFERRDGRCREKGREHHYGGTSDCRLGCMTLCREKSDTSYRMAAFDPKLPLGVRGTRCSNLA